MLFRLGTPADARTLKLDAQDVKVAMIGKIAEFVRWPADAGLDDPQRPLEFVVMGATPLESRLTRYYGQVRIAGHRVFVRRARDLDDIGHPHVLFLGPSVDDDLERTIKALKDAATLTVADTEGFAQRGVAVNLYVAEEQVRFEVSRRALQRQRLAASYHLLTLARLVGDQQARRD
jgi:hypothetical protein